MIDPLLGKLGRFSDDSIHVSEWYYLFGSERRALLLHYLHHFLVLIIDCTAIAAAVIMITLGRP
jgi:hypothetical protein